MAKMHVGGAEKGLIEAFEARNELKRRLAMG